MAGMQGRDLLSAIFDWNTFRLARLCAGLVGLWGPMATGRKVFSLDFSPMGGDNRDAGYNRVICGTQSVPRVSQELRRIYPSLLRNAQAMIRPQADALFSLDVNAHIEEW